MEPGSFSGLDLVASLHEGAGVGDTVSIQTGLGGPTGDIEAGRLVHGFIVACRSRGTSPPSPRALSALASARSMMTASSSSSRTRNVTTQLLHADVARAIQTSQSMTRPSGRREPGDRSNEDRSYDMREDSVWLRRWLMGRFEPYEWGGTVVVGPLRHLLGPPVRLPCWLCSRARTSGSAEGSGHTK